jgi:hypothetical protein
MLVVETDCSRPLCPAVPISERTCLIDVPGLFTSLFCCLARYLDFGPKKPVVCPGLKDLAGLYVKIHGLSRGKLGNRALLRVFPQGDIYSYGSMKRFGAEIKGEKKNPWPREGVRPGITFTRHV